MVLFDNIPRGTAITCPEIEKLLTSEEITDRVLGREPHRHRLGKDRCRLHRQQHPPGRRYGQPDLEDRHRPRSARSGEPRVHATPIRSPGFRPTAPRLLGALLTIMAGNPTLQRRHEAGFQPETRFKILVDAGGLGGRARRQAL